MEYDPDMQRPGAPLSYSAEKELRTLLEGKEDELEEKRRRMSRTVTRVLLLGGTGLVALVVFYPVSEKPAMVNKSPLMEKAAQALPGMQQGQMPQVFAPVAEDREMDKELQPFSIKPEQTHGNKDDIRFAMELLNFMQPGAKPAEAPKTTDASVKKPVEGDLAGKHPSRK